MKEKSLNRSFLVFVVSILAFSMISSSFAASLTITPTSGPVGTQITATGTGFTNAGTILNTKAYSGSNTNFVAGTIIAEKFSGLPSGQGISKIGLTLFTNGAGNFTDTLAYSNTDVNFVPPMLIAERFSNLPNGAIITKVGVDITSGTGPLRVKIYDALGSTGTGPPRNLLAESGSNNVGGAGTQNFTLTTPATVPLNGVVYVAFQTNTTSLHFGRSIGIGASTYYNNTAPYGSGPNPFTGTAIVGGDGYWMQITYQVHTPHVRVKVYDDSNGGKPGNLLAESGSLNLLSGPNNYTLNSNAVIPGDGNIYAAFQTESTAPFFDRTSPAGETTYSNGTTNTFGSGPNPFGTAHSLGGDGYWMQITYFVTNLLTFKFNGSVVSTTPPSPSPNSTGGFSGVTFNVPVILVGPYSVLANDSYGISNSKTFTVNLPSVTSTITGSVLYSTSSLTPLITYSSPPSSLTATQNQLSRNGSYTVTNSISNTVSPGGTTISSIGETMVGPSSYFVTTTLSDGANTFTVNSNTVTLTPGTSPPSNGTKCGLNGCPIKTVVTYSAHRNAAFTKLHISALVIPIPFNAECNISNGTFSNTHRWYNFSGITVLNFNASVPPHDSAGYICYGSGVLFSGISPGNQTVAQAGANIFNNSFGAIIGIPAGMFIVVLIGSLANQRTGPIYLIASLCVAGILATIGFFVLDTGWWAMSLIFGMLGLLVGRKVF